MTEYKVLVDKILPPKKDTPLTFSQLKLSCPAAVNRFKIGVPATYEHAVGDNKNDVGKSAKYIADTVSVSLGDYKKYQ
jgi:ESCRT-I complex subunit VPS28